MRIGIWCHRIRYHTAVWLGFPRVNHLCSGTQGDGNLAFLFLFFFFFSRQGYNDGIMAWFPPDRAGGILFMAWMGIYQFGMGWDWTVSNIMFCFCLGDEGHDDWEPEKGKLLICLLATYHDWAGLVFPFFSLSLRTTTKWGT